MKTIISFFSIIILISCTQSNNDIRKQLVNQYGTDTMLLTKQYDVDTSVLNLSSHQNNINIFDSLLVLSRKRAIENKYLNLTLDFISANGNVKNPYSKHYYAGATWRHEFYKNSSNEWYPSSSYIKPIYGQSGLVNLVVDTSFLYEIKNQTEKAYFTQFESILEGDDLKVETQFDTLEVNQIYLSNEFIIPIAGKIKLIKQKVYVIKEEDTLEVNRINVFEDQFVWPMWSAQYEF